MIWLFTRDEASSQTRKQRKSASKVKKAASRTTPKKARKGA